MGVALGSAVGGTVVLEDGYVAVSNHGKEWLVDPDYAPPFLYQGLIPSSLASEVALKFDAHGPAVVISTGCTSGIDAIGYGHQMIQDGEADVIISGASESPISPISMACFDPIKATSQRNDDAAHASRPFDRDRDGFVMGEGCAILILEELESALARGAHIYCEVVGYATRGNAYHMTGLRPEAYAMTEAILDAMRQADVKPEDIDYINAHGSGTKQNDRHETNAYKKTLGRAGLQDPDQLDQVDDRPFARRDRRDRDGRVRAGHRPWRGSADGQLGEPRPGVRPRLHPERRRPQDGA